MTTVVFDGKILAVDSMCSVHRGETEETCAKCDTSVSRTVKTYVKLRVPKKPAKFKGKPVVAITGAGATDWTNGIIHCVENELDIEATIKAMSMFTSNTSRPRLPFAGRAMVVTTDGACWFLEAEGNKFKETEVKEFPVSIGSGSKAALTAIKFMGLGPVEAVMVASDIDESTGGDVSWVSLEAPDKVETIKFTPGFADKFKKSSRVTGGVKTSPPTPAESVVLATAMAAKKPVKKPVQRAVRVPKSPQEKKKP